MVDDQFITQMFLYLSMLMKLEALTNLDECAIVNIRYAFAKTLCASYKLDCLNICNFIQQRVVNSKTILKLME
jgi:hypothetical protein